MLTSVLTCRQAKGTSPQKPKKEANRMNRMRLDYIILDLIHDYRQHKALMQMVNRRGNLATWIVNLVR